MRFKADLKMRPKSPFTVYWYLCGTSIFFIVGGTLLICLWSIVNDFILENNMVLKQDNYVFSVWKKNPIPLKIEFFFFNWTNPQDIYNTSTKPRLQQMGPYTFIETKEKSNITWNSNGTVSYKHLRRWYFDEANCKNKLSDMVTTINPVALSAAYTSRNWSYFIKKGLSVTLGSMGSQVHVTKTVGELLFEGYEDPLMKMATQFPFLARMELPDRFGWFYGRNGSEDYEGVFNTHTGTHKRLGEIYSWKYKNHTSYYDSPCDNVEGSSGEFFPRNMTKEKPIKFFNADLCKKVELEFDKEVKIHNILGYKYSAQGRFLDNGTKVPENKCSCIGDCMPSGAVNVSACRFGSPAFVSLPNFNKADPYYINNIDGLHPDNDNHDFYMIFEPKTAMPLEVAARLQINLRLQPIEDVKLYENVPTVYFPMLWFQQVIRMPESMTFYIKILLNLQVICTATGILLIVLGLFIQFCTVYKVCTMNLCGKKGTPNVNSWKEQMPLNPDTTIELVKTQ